MSLPTQKPAHRQAFTLVELLVVIAIIGILVGLLTPAVQAMRESSRRVTCQSRLTPIGMALLSYHDRWQHFPVGTIDASGPIKSVATGNHHNWLGRLTDLLDQPVIADRIDRTTSVYDEANADVLQLGYPGVRCPSSVTHLSNISSYIGFHHPVEKPIDETNWGVFLLNKPISRDDVSDGLSNTAFVSEKITPFDDLGWLSGTRATIRNGGPIGSSQDFSEGLDPSLVGSIGSFHPAGVHVLFGSGAIKFQSHLIDQRVLQQMIDRRDGQLPIQFQSIETLRRESVQ